jgi:hypothetical protein
MPNLEPGVEIHQDLNPLIWNDYTLRSEVRNGLLEIAREFFKFLTVPVEVKDIIITGSQCSYTYTEHSDLDLHIIVPYENVACDQPVEELFDTKRKLWKLRHTITIHGIPVECYAEDHARPVKGSTYSLLKDTWVSKPTHPQGDIDQDIDRVCLAWITLISHAIQERDLDGLKQIKDLLSKYRKQGLSRSGELGRANVVFKTLRNSGVIAQLMQALLELEDRKLSVK